MDSDSLTAMLELLGQEQLHRCVSSNNNNNDKAPLLQQITNLQLKESCKFFEVATGPSSPLCLSEQSKIKPIHPNSCASAINDSEENLKKYWNLGLESISRGQVGVILLAGGQGTRLGVSYPKGMYDVDLPSHSSLFTLQALRIKKLEQLAMQMYPSAGKACIYWYVMTSAATRQATQTYFQDHDHWGLAKEQVTFFDQGQLPCFSFDGQILMDSHNSIATAPDGNGGLYRALGKEGILNSMESNGIQYLHVYCVDNILVRPADPHFIGFCIDKKADCGAKVVERKDPFEPVGVICNVDGRGASVVEYSELPTQLASMKDDKDHSKLAFRAGNICNHFFTIQFLKDVVLHHEPSLAHHVARKKIAHIDKGGALIKPDKPNGIKLEKFIFDVFPFSKNMVVWEVDRDSEFSPLKNADTAEVDCPSSCRDAIDKLHRNYLKQCNITPPEKGLVEIHPLISYAGEGLLESEKLKCLFTK